ncbi:ArnT family glycosyltransferase [Thalassoroseus pseudoceratinae]|uniref:ArnT family glycosyltransferase n=1 Tax=Thalassoroseus pseudoceratinae TaxID=2713176 RepID=UPI00141F037B|nr:glycosyltransferase family 39 protein [Thalassoroseus pseudoceratinae]
MLFGADSVLPLRRPLQPPAIAKTDARTSQQYWQRIAVFGLIFAAGLMFFFRLGDFRVLGSHEVFAVAPARAMLETGDWVVPMYGGYPRLEKPPLIYWCLASWGQVCGDVSAATARFPTALAAVLLAALLGWWGNRWYSRWVGLAAALVQMTSIWVLIYGRKAEVDMLLCLLTTGTLLLVIEQPKDEDGLRSFIRWTVIFGMLAVTWLAKFHYGLGMVLPVVLMSILAERNWRRLWSFFNPLGWAFLAAAMLIWPYLVLQELPDAHRIWQRETLGRAVGTLGQDTWYYYGPKLLWMALPWTPFALLVVRESWRSAWIGRDRRERFLWIWLLTQFVVLSLSANKHKQYLMATLPVISLLSARGLVRLTADFATQRRQLGPSWCRGLIVATWCGGIALASVFWMREPELRWAGVWTGIAFATIGTVGFNFLRNGRVPEAMTATVLNLFVCTIIQIGWVMPARDPRSPLEEIAATCESVADPGRSICVYRLYREGLFCFLDTPAYCEDSAERFVSNMDSGERQYLIGWKPFIEDLNKSGRVNHLHVWPKTGTRTLPHMADLTLAEFIKD